MSSYLTAILPNLLSGRKKVTPGYFWMKGPIGFVVNTVACLFMMVFIVLFCFPVCPQSPIPATYMSYANAGFSSQCQSKSQR